MFRSSTSIFTPLAEVSIFSRKEIVGAFAENIFNKIPCRKNMVGDFCFDKSNLINVNSGKEKVKQEKFSELAQNVSGVAQNISVFAQNFSGVTRNISGQAWKISEQPQKSSGKAQRVSEVPQKSSEQEQ